MNKCEHGQKISKFCVTEHCHHKEAAGCDYCIRKYHFHLTNTILLSEANIDELLKKVTLPTDSKYKTRSLQQGAIEYLRTLKNSMNNWIDQAQNAIIDRLSHPLLRKSNLLTTYNRLKYKEYRKISAKELRALNEFSQNHPSESLKKDQIAGYYQEVDWVTNILAAAERLAAELVKLPQMKEGEGLITLPSKTKLSEVLESIKRQAQHKLSSGSVSSSKPQSVKWEENGSTKRRQSEEKKEQTPVKEPGKNGYEGKRINNGSLANDPSLNENVTAQEGEKQVPNEALTKIPFESKEERQKRLRKRRASIDDNMDFKFGPSIEEKAKQYQQRKKRLIDNVNHQRKQSQEKMDKKEEEKFKEDNLLHLKYGKIQQTKGFTSSHSDRGRIMPIPEFPNHQQQTEPSSADKRQNDSLNEGMGFMQTIIDNILPPLPPACQRNEPVEPMIPKIIKIPMVVKEEADQIQSPILKNRKKKSNVGGGFAIALNPTDQIIEKPLRKEQSEQEGLSPKQDNEECIVLELNQKNSLLLFSEALGSPIERAVELLKAALKYSPNNLSAAQYLSYLYLEGGKAKECLDICQSILVHIEDTPQQFQITLHLHNNRAAALNMLGRYSESIMILQKCLRFRRKHYFYKNLADAYFSLGIPEKATMNYEKAVKLDSEYDEAFYNLAVTQFIQQEYSSAMVRIKQALRIDNSNDNYIQLQKEIAKKLQSSHHQ